MAMEVLPSPDAAAIQTELAEFQSSSQIKHAFRSSESVCESSFSPMNAIKMHARNRLSLNSLEDCLHIKTWNISGNIHSTVSDGRFFHISK